MNVLIIPDGFKDSLSAADVANAIENGIHSIYPSAKTWKLVASDGGDGFLNAVKHYKPQLEAISVQSTDPLNKAITADYLYDGQAKIAYVELASASGIELLSKQQRLVMKTTTTGTGTLIRHALGSGAKQIYVGLGGSATNDAGIGIATAFGWKFLDIYENELLPKGENLNLIKTIKRPQDGAISAEIIAINDVQNPMYGPAGAAYTYARQKGASDLQIQLLDSGLKHLSQLVKDQLGIDAGDIPGTGAAGATAYGLKVFLGARFEPGTPFMFRLSGFYEVLQSNKIDLIITGEGCIDDQTQHGKLISGIVEAAVPFGVPVYAICGLNKLSSAGIKALGVAEAVQLYDPIQPEGYSFSHAAELVAERAQEIMRSL